MADYIERDAAIERIFPCPVLSSDAISRENVVAWMAGVGDAKEQIRAMIKEFPVADVAPVVHGRWEKFYYDEDWDDFVRDCSVCGKSHPDLSTYCPNCGARMEGE